MQPKLIYKNELDWKGIVYGQELYEADDFSNLSPIKQVSGVCFLDDKYIVFAKHIDGYLSLPGGGPEQGETIEQSLRRELNEEAAVEVIEYGPIGYIRYWRKKEPENIKYQLRFWAKVKLNGEVNDPCNKSIGREIVPIGEAVGKLDWGNDGEALINLAIKKAGI